MHKTNEYIRCNTTEFIKSIFVRFPLGDSTEFRKSYAMFRFFIRKCKYTVIFSANFLILHNTGISCSEKNNYNHNKMTILFSILNKCIIQSINSRQALRSPHNMHIRAIIIRFKERFIESNFIAKFYYCFHFESTQESHLIIKFN